MWLIYALLSAIFAGLTAILVKVGVSGISANLATAIRTIVVLIMSWMVVFLAGKPDFTSLSKKNITFFNFIRFGNWRFMVDLQPCTAIRASIQSHPS